MEIKCQLDAGVPARKPYTWLSASHNTDNLKTKAPNTTGSSHLYNTLKLLMMGIMVPETCWASNKICNKNHLLHLVGILFPHNNDDARSKSHQINFYIIFTMGHMWPLPSRFLKQNLVGISMYSLSVVYIYHFILFCWYFVLFNYGLRAVSSIINTTKRRSYCSVIN